MKNQTRQSYVMKTTRSLIAIVHYVWEISADLCKSGHIFLKKLPLLGPTFHHVTELLIVDFTIL